MRTLGARWVTDVRLSSFLLCSERSVRARARVDVPELILLFFRTPMADRLSGGEWRYATSR